jgi:hypothetical protein
MEGTKPDKLLAALCERDTAAANEPHQLIRSLHPLDLCLVDQHYFCAFRVSGKKVCQATYMLASR